MTLCQLVKAISLHEPDVYVIAKGKDHKQYEYGNKVVVAGKEFLLTGVNGEYTDTLEFAYTVTPNDKIGIKRCL
jgi:hypothetical protein